MLFQAIIFFLSFFLTSYQLPRYLRYSFYSTSPFSPLLPSPPLSSPFHLSLPIHIHTYIRTYKQTKRKTPSIQPTIQPSNQVFLA